MYDIIVLSCSIRNQIKLGILFDKTVKNRYGSHSKKQELTVKWLFPIFRFLHPSSAYGSPPDRTRLGRNLV